MSKPNPDTALYKLWVLLSDKSKSPGNTRNFYSYPSPDEEQKGFTSLFQLAEKMRKNEQWTQAVIYHNTGDKHWIVRLYTDGTKQFNDAPATIPQH